MVAAKEFPAQQVAVVLQEGEVEVTEELDMLVFHFELLRGVPVNGLKHMEGASVSGVIDEY